MIEAIRFQNFKCLRDTTLPLSACTVIVGPNGSGKTTVLQALEGFATSRGFSFQDLVTANLRNDPKVDTVQVWLEWGEPFARVEHCMRGHRSGAVSGKSGEGAQPEQLHALIRRTGIYSLDATAIAAPVALHHNMELASNGAGLAGVLDGLRDQEPERFETLNDELGQWLPEFDRLLFDLDGTGRRLFLLRTRDGGYSIPASALSQGTLLALAMLTMIYVPKPPFLIGLEEPDRGIHPYLLRRVQEVLYRLSHPESFGENREPVQVVATTHSPYFVDLFKDHPEEIVIANKVGLDVQFQRLTDQPNIKEILGSAPLGEAWYTGVLGGVPSTP